MIREEHALKRRQVVEEPRERHVLDPRVVDQGAARLLLKGVDAAIELIPTRRVRPPRPGVGPGGPGQRHVVDGRHHTSDVDHHLE